MIVRRDLPIGVLGAQIIHAAGESSPGGLTEGTYAVALAVPDEVALAAEAVRLRSRGFAHLSSGQDVGRTQAFGSERLAFVTIHEPDEPYRGALMAIGIVPARKEVLRRHLASIPILK